MLQLRACISAESHASCRESRKEPCTLTKSMQSNSAELMCMRLMPNSHQLSIVELHAFRQDAPLSAKLHACSLCLFVWVVRLLHLHTENVGCSTCDGWKNKRDSDGQSHSVVFSTASFHQGGSKIRAANAARCYVACKNFRSIQQLT
jgi:hypothetical protein